MLRVQIEVNESISYFPTQWFENINVFQNHLGVLTDTNPWAPGPSDSTSEGPEWHPGICTGSKHPPSDSDGGAPWMTL